jgi:hypothetical protein
MRINTLEKPVTSIDYKRLITSSDSLKMTKTEAQVLLDWVREGMDIPVYLVTQALLITGDISPLALR